ncbi:MAG: LuxR C-terminal-related transcriptional regulator [Pseudonocardia sp.]
MRARHRGSGLSGNRLPVPPGPLVGRGEDCAALARLLGERRLVTVTGPPGVGKTRLAIAAAAAAPDPAVFVDLTTIRDPTLVRGAALGALGVSDRARTRGPDSVAVLAVLDNFEHVLDAAPAVAEVLAAFPALRVLVTSRERLRLRGEHEVPVAPLALPAAKDGPERTAAAPAVQMLVGEVAAFDPTFRVSSANAGALAEICIRLDGLPLALELAAARLRLFTPGELTFRLRNRLSVLTGTARDLPQRHRTLRAALAWSHDLLGPRERMLFRRAAVFSGGATLDAIEQVCALDGAEGLVQSLVDKSLLQRRTRRGEVAEFAMLESLREFAADLLDASGETDGTRARHARYFAGRAARIEARIGTAHEGTADVEAIVEEGNLRAALGWARATDDPDPMLRLAATLGWDAYIRGRLGDGRAVIEQAVDAVDAAGARGVAVPDDALAAVLLAAGVVAVGADDLDRARTRLGACIAVSERSGDVRRTAIAEAFLGHAARAGHDHPAAIRHYRRAGLLHGRLGNANGVAWSRYDRGLLARQQGRTDEALTHLRAALPHFRESGHAWGVGCTAWALATVELRRGRVAAASALLTEAIGGHEAADDARGLAQCLEATAAVCCAHGGEARSAARLLGAAEALRERIAAPLPEEDRDEHVGVVRSVGRDLGPDAADRERCTGRAAPQQAAVALARAVLAGPPDPLTRREREVAGLVARGHTNRQIARALGMAEKTAQTHVHNIIRKLGAQNRAEVAARVVTASG